MQQVETHVTPGRYEPAEVVLFVDREFDRIVPIAQMDRQTLDDLREAETAAWTQAQAQHLAVLTALDIRDFELSDQPALPLEWAA